MLCLQNYTIEYPIIVHNNYCSFFKSLNISKLNNLGNFIGYNQILDLSISYYLNLTEKLKYVDRQIHFQNMHINLIFI